MATATAAEVYLYGTIGEDITERSFVDELRYLSDEPKIDIRINSGGGSVVAGLAMHSAIMRARSAGQSVRTYNDGAAFSMAAILLQAGTVRYVANNSLTMLHNPFTDQGGDSRELRKKADSLDKVAAELIDIVATRSGRSREMARAWLDAESWFDANEAIAAGLADFKFSDAPKSVHGISTDVFARYNVPAKYRDTHRGPIDKLVTDCEAWSRMSAKAIYHEWGECNYRVAVQAAAQLLRMPGHTNSDVCRVSDAIERAKAALNAPRPLNPYDR